MVMNFIMLGMIGSVWTHSIQNSTRKGAVMQLPIDIKAVIDEATNIDEARRTTLSVSVYLDDSAPGDVQAHVRQAFASASPHARVSLMYLDGRPFAPFSGDASGPSSWRV